MKENRYLEELGKPFPASDVSWRMQYVDKEKVEGFAVPYLDARAISDRLDNVVGQFNWKDNFSQWHCYDKKDINAPDKRVDSQLCAIYIYDEDKNEWVGKTDGAENTDFEPIKGGLSDSYKRCAVKWNIGRYLYKFEPVWVKATKQGKNYIVDSKEKPRLEQIYNNKVISIFGEAAKSIIGVPNSSGTTNSSNQNTVDAGAKKQASDTKANSTKDGDKTHEVFEVKNIRVEKEGEVARSTLVLNNGNVSNTMFMYGSDPKLKTGTKLINLRGKRKTTAYGTYLILESYDIAA